MDRGRRARSGEINNILEIKTCADGNCFFFDFGYFCSFFNKILGCYGKTDKRKIKIIFLIDRSRPGGSVKINNILEIETRADENDSFISDFGYFCSFFK